MKIVTVLGARPQFIKAAAISYKLRKRNTEIIIHTGQHYDYEMSAIFFEELNIPKPDYNLQIGSGIHGMQTGKMLIKIEELLLKEKPDMLLIYGDTNSTLAGAIAASKLSIPIAHIEAGVRLFNKASPEEQNRIVADHLSSYLFAPVERAVKNLSREGITEHIYNVGDVMYDASIYFKNIALNKSIFREDARINNFILATIHRPINTDNYERMKNIVEALNECGQKIIFPFHPRTKKFVESYGLKLSSNIIAIDPVGYLDMVYLEIKSNKIITDSGGVQREAYFYKKPCITVLEGTEWTDTVEDKWNILTGTDKEAILKAIENFDPTNQQNNVFGDGKASIKICTILNSIAEHII